MSGSTMNKSMGLSENEPLQKDSSSLILPPWHGKLVKNLESPRFPGRRQILLII